MSDNGEAEGKPWYFYEQLTRSTVKQYGGVRGTEESRARWQGCVERRPAGKEQAMEEGTFAVDGGNP